MGKSRVVAQLSRDRHLSHGNLSTDGKTEETAPVTDTKLFPAWIIDGQKVPLIRGWKYHENASSDPVQFQTWTEQFRERITFWGIPTGKGNDLLVLDIDIKSNGWGTIQSHGLQIPDTRQQKTLNGGSHYVFKYPKDGKHYGNKVGFLPGLDIRAEGGWIAYYGWVDPTKPILDAPQWLLDLISKSTPVGELLSPVKLSPEIAEGIFRTSIETIRNAPPGESNNVLNVESFKVGQLVGSGSLLREYAEAELFRAAKERGKPDFEAKATIKSGLDGGVKNPMTCPFALEAPKLAFDIPEAPKPPERWTPHYFTKYDLMNMSKLRKPQLFQDWSTEDISITTADGGTGKTTLALYEAICMALGDRFLGFECKCPGGKTLFITGEDTDKKLAAMLGAVMRQMGLFDGQPENEAKIQTILSSIIVKKDSDLCLITKTREGFLIPNVQAKTNLLQAITDFKPKKIVFDPIASFWGSESALNDMNKAVTKFMSELVEHQLGVEMINHMGKSSSANKDMTQFAGRGGSGLPSNSRVAKVLHSIKAEDYRDLTGEELEEGKSAMVCCINKFSDGSPLLNKQFLIIREGYLFTRKVLSAAKESEMRAKMSDMERVFMFIKDSRKADKYPTKGVIAGSFMFSSEPISETRVKKAIEMLQFQGHLGEKIRIIDHPDMSIREKAIIVIDQEGKEI